MVGTFRFLFDECLTPDLVGVANSHGFDATHVNFRQRQGYPDYALMPLVLADDFIFVTNNGADFRPIYRAFDVHPGLVVVLPSVRRDRQVEMFTAVIEKIGDSRDLINKLIEVDANCVVTIVDWPPDLSNRQDD